MVDIRLDDLEEVVEAVDNVDPVDLANYLLEVARSTTAPFKPSTLRSGTGSKSFDRQREEKRWTGRDLNP